MYAKRSFIHDRFQISMESYEIGWNMPCAHSHEAYEIYILLSGTRTIFIKDNIYCAESNTATLFSKNTPHKSFGDSSFHGICIHFSDNYLKEYLSSTGFLQYMHCFEFPIISLPQEAVMTIENIAHDFVTDSPDNFLHLLTILHLLCKHSNHGVKHYGIEDIKSSSIHTSINDISKKDRILRYVDENYINIETIESLADLFQVSQRHIYRLYQSTYHVTPKYYINLLRIKHACHLIQYSNHTMRYISKSCGYESYEYFYKVFKKEMKCTPLNYRILSRK